MQRVSVRIGEEQLMVLMVPCPDRFQTLRWLGVEALRRCAETRPGEGLSSEEEFVIRSRADGRLLDLEESISSALDDGDSIELCNPAESHFFVRFLKKQYIYLDGNSLTTVDLFSLGKGLIKIKVFVYGVNTGFGKFAGTVVRKDQLKELQENLVRSHSAGVGPPLSPERTRMLLALRINTLAKGHSGVSLETLQKMVAAFNESCLSWVPEKGTVGASGDLSPLAHLALGLMGEGRMWSPLTGWTESSTVLEAHGLTPISLKPKEGIALINGTQMMSALGAEAVERAEAVARQADVIAALTLEVLRGTNKAFDKDVHAVRPHPGQTVVAQHFRSLLHSDIFPSEIAEDKPYDRVQDAYTLRCCPQVHGVAVDTIAFVKKILNTELNSGTDNPLVFAERGVTLSGGNFHGEYPAKALDFLSIGVHELASISERRIERLCNPSLSELPAFLVKDGGLNSGFMVAHCTAAALVSENKALCHPASVDSISTSAATEDHVSMGGWAARKALRVVEHVEQVLAIELLAACQALEFHRPLRTTAPLEKVYELLRSVVRLVETISLLGHFCMSNFGLLKVKTVVFFPTSSTCAVLTSPRPPDKG
uniref:Histidine ammonia-lyase n=1 Tax=Astyanax mexicanus TaxID=7994 RepID=A0A8B9KF05_ASTMX